MGESESHQQIADFHLRIGCFFCMCSFAYFGSLSGQNIDNFGCLHLLSGSCFYACLDFLEVVGDDSLGMESDHMSSQLGIQRPAIPTPLNTSSKKVVSGTCGDPNATSGHPDPGLGFADLLQVKIARHSLCTAIF